MTDRLVVVGGGVAGLVVAYEAARAGLRVTLLEAGPETGGLLRRGTLAGVDVDLGAESFATRTDGVAELAEELGLETCEPRPEGARLVVERDGEIVRAPLPRRTVLGVPADPLADDVVRLIGEAAARRAAAETAAPVSGPEPSLAELVAARCGTGLVTGLVDPLCQSVYSRPADRVRLSEVHPGLWAALVETGSLREAAARVSTGVRPGAAVAGIVGGMWRLPARLRERAEAAGADVRTGVAVRSIGRGQARTDDAVWTADHVVVATGPAAARALLGAPAVAAHPVRVVSALVTGSALDARPTGSGAIVAAGVPSAAKALTHTTAKWPWAERQAGLGPGRHLVRLSARHAAIGLETPADIARELALLTGVEPGEVEQIATAVWADAVPTAPLDAALVASAEADGIHLAGATVAGTGLASVVPHARRLARTLIDGPAVNESAVNEPARSTA